MKGFLREYKKTKIFLGLYLIISIIVFIAGRNCYLSMPGNDICNMLFGRWFKIGLFGFFLAPGIWVEVAAWNVIGINFFNSHPLFRDFLLSFSGFFIALIIVIISIVLSKRNKKNYV